MKNLITKLDQLDEAISKVLEDLDDISDMSEFDAPTGFWKEPVRNKSSRDIIFTKIRKIIKGLRGSIYNISGDCTIFVIETSRGYPAVLLDLHTQEAWVARDLSPEWYERVHQFGYREHPLEGITISDITKRASIRNLEEFFEHPDLPYKRNSDLWRVHWKRYAELTGITPKEARQKFPPK